MSAETPQALRGFLQAMTEADQASCPPQLCAEFAATLNGVMRSGRRRAVIVSLGRLPLPKFAGRYRAIATGLLLTFVASWPYLLVLVAGPFLPRWAELGPRGQLYGVLQSVICAVMLVLAQLGWTLAESFVPSVAGLLAASPDREGFARWLARTLRLPRQLVPSAAAMVFTIVPTYLTFRMHGGTALLVYLPSAWTGFLGGNVLYWLFCAAGVPFRIRRCRNLRLTWIDPAHTPGIVSLCKVYILVSAGVGVGVLLTELSAIAFSSEESHPLLNLFIYGFPVFAALTALYVGAQPIITLGRTVRLYQKQIFGPLMTQVAEPPENLAHRQDLKDVFETYKHFKALRTLPIKSWAIMQYVAGIVASLVVYFVQQGVK
jgi:hypothetical protein